MHCWPLVAAVNASASTILVANLTNSQENPPTNPTLTGGAPRPASFGTASFFIHDAMTFMAFTATIFNIDVTGSQTADTNDNLVAAHIHAGQCSAGEQPCRLGIFRRPLQRQRSQ